LVEIGTALRHQLELACAKAYEPFDRYERGAYDWLVALDLERIVPENGQKEGRSMKTLILEYNLADDEPEEAMGKALRWSPQGSD
jgi:hypothetical protein